MFDLFDTMEYQNPGYIKCRIQDNTLLDIFSWKPLSRFAIPRQVTYHHTWKMYDQFPDLNELHAHPDSEVYRTFDGALYHKRSLTLLYIPRGKTSLHIPAWAAGIGHQALCAPISEIKLDPYNPHFRLVDGCLYNAGMTSLYFVPGSRDELYIPASLEYIDESVFHRSFLNIRVDEGNRVFSLSGGALCERNRLLTLPLMAESLHIGARITQLPDLSRFPFLRHVTVDQDHPDYAAWDNVLYDLTFPQILFIPRDLGHLILPDELTDLLPCSTATYIFLRSVTVPVNTRFSAASFSCFPMHCRIFVRLEDGSKLELPHDTAARACCIQTLHRGNPEIKAGSELFHLDLFLNGSFISNLLHRVVKVSSMQILKAVVEANDLGRMQAVIENGQLLTHKNVPKLAALAESLGHAEMAGLLRSALPEA